MKVCNNRNLTITPIIPTLYKYFKTYDRAINYLHFNGIKYPKKKFLILWKDYLTPKDDTPIFVYPDNTCLKPKGNGEYVDLTEMGKYLWTGKLFYVDKTGYDKIDYIGFITNELLSRQEGEGIFKQAIRRAKSFYQMKQVREFKHTGLYQLVANKEKNKPTL